MAILDKDQLSKILKEKPNHSMLQTSVELNERLLRFTSGLNLDKLYKRVAFIESQNLFDSRKQLKKSAVDLYERIIKLRGKVFSAKGGSRIIPLPENKEKQLINYLQSIRNGISLRKFIELSLIRAWDSDPMGLCFIEISDDAENPLPYPTYKNVSSIYAYEFNWRNLEYVIFKLTAEEKKKAVENGYITKDESEMTGTFLRVVDDSRDFMIVYSGEGKYELLKNSEVPNPWSRVPGFILSNMPDKKNERLISTIEPVIELAERYMERDADIALQEKLHGTLKFWTSPIACTACSGHKMIDGADCKRCKGSGVELKPDISTTLVIPESTNEQKFNIPPAGFIAPPKESFDLIQNRLNHYQELIKETYWGSIKHQKAEGPDVGDTVTATEILSTDNKEEITLNAISDWAQETEEYITNFIGEFIFGSFKGSSVSYGRRYVIKTPDELRKSYEEAKSKNLAESIKDDAYADFLESKYEKDPVQLAIQYKLFKLEPFFHYSIDQVKAIVPDPELIKRKLFFGEWKKEKSDMELLNTEFNTLKSDFENYVKGIELQPEQPATAGAASNN